MAAVALVSAKGSPGVTTAAAALAAVAAADDGGAMLVELDPSGGSLQVLTSSEAPTGLVEAAGELRRDTSSRAIGGNTAEVPDGIRSLVAPTSGSVAESIIHSVGDRWMPVLLGAAATVVVDAGRWDSQQRTARRIAGADILVAVCRPTVAGVEHTRHILDRLGEVGRCPATVLVVGSRPYPPEEVAHHLDVPLAGTIAWDPRGAARLWSRGASRGWLRTLLARSAASALAGLVELAATRPLGTMDVSR